MPLIAVGKQPQPPGRHGFHWHLLEAFGMEMGAPFILDGEAFPAGAYRVSQGPVLRFVVP